MNRFGLVVLVLSIAYGCSSANSKFLADAKPNEKREVYSPSKDPVYIVLTAEDKAVEGRIEASAGLDVADSHLHEALTEFCRYNTPLKDRAINANGTDLLYVWTVLDYKDDRKKSRTLSYNKR